MHKSRPSPIVYVKSMPGGEDVWQYTSSNDQIFCMACEAGIPYQASNLKFRIEKHITSGKLKKEVSQRVRQSTLAFRAQENEFDRELATALVMENIPLSKVEGKFLKPFIAKFTEKVLPSQSTLRKTYMPKISNSCAELLQKFKEKDSLRWMRRQMYVDKAFAVH